MTTFVTHSAAETSALGRSFAASLRPGDVVALYGNLGSGKTAFVAGVCEGLGARGHVSSPTFTLINEYPGRLPLVHLDVYRLSGPRDLEDMGYEEYFYGGGVIVIEWAEKIRDVLPDRTLFVCMRYVDENTREMVLEGPEEKMRMLEERLQSGGSLSWR